MSNPPATPAAPSASLAFLPPPVRAVVEKGRAWWEGLSRPARILMVSTTVMAAVIIGFVGYSQTHEPYAVLFAQLDQEDAAATVAKLKEMKAPYQLEAGSSTILVPESKVADLRLELASAGVLRGGGVGFESFDKMKLGATEFEQHVLYRRALEGELSRTIGSIAAVQSARVHLVLPEKSVFVTRAEPASASVVLKLRAGRTLGPSEVAGIVHLTASSVSGLTADKIAVVTTEGEMLKKPRPDGAAAGTDDDRLAEQRTTETQLEERARAMLERVVGVGHVDVRVTAELDSARTERTEDHYEPTRTALRSEESSTERASGANGVDDSVAGVPGAESNVPGGSAPATKQATAATPIPATAGLMDGGAPVAAAAPAPANSAIAAGSVRESHTRNFEVDHVSEKRFTGPGGLKRLAVAVVLDGVPHYENGMKTMVPRDHAEIERLTALVRSAVGANDNRGDSITVDSVPFEDTKVVDEAPPPPVSALARFSGLSPKVRYGILGGAGFLTLLATALTVRSIRAAARRRREKIAEEVQARAIAALPAPVILDAQLDTKIPTIDLRAAALERAAADPATTALVLRAWLGATDSAEPKPLATVRAA